MGESSSSKPDVTENINSRTQGQIIIIKLNIENKLIKKKNLSQFSLVHVEAYALFLFDIQNYFILITSIGRPSGHISILDFGQ